MCNIVNNIFSSLFLGLQTHIIVWSVPLRSKKEGRHRPPHSIQFYYILAHRVQYNKQQFTRYFIKMCVHSNSVSGSVIGSTRRDKSVSEGVGISSVIIGQGRRLLGKDLGGNDLQKAEIGRGGDIQGEQIVGVSIYGARLGIVPVQSIKFEL